MYFLALVCPGHIDEKILQFKYWMRDHFNCIVALKSPAHITLVPPFWFPEIEEPQLIGYLHGFSSPATAHPLSISGFSHFEKRVLYAVIDENAWLIDLQASVAAYFGGFIKIQKPGEGKSFHPHITIANRDMKKGDFDKAWQYFSTKKFTESFTPDKLSLLKLREGKWEVVAEQRW
jgi:2'-5' RNA ligase